MNLSHGFASSSCSFCIRFETVTTRIGAPKSSFRVLVEIVRKNNDVVLDPSAYVALTKLHFVSCFEREYIAAKSSIVQ